MSKIRVVVVNDQIAVNELWQQMLDMTDDMTCVGTARNGMEAVQLADELTPDIVIMDVMMPGMDGTEATRIIRERHPNTQIIVYSAYNGMEQRAYESGAVEYLLMPIGPDKLRDTIRRVYHEHNKPQ
ncbi:response regulator [Aggregatilineales bacterium SYSU G02658]